MKQEIILNRSDDRPVAFMGELLVDVNTRGDDPRNKKSRWHRARVYKTDNGLKLGMAHITCYENERDQYWVLNAKDDQEIYLLISQHITDQEEADELTTLVEDQLKSIPTHKKQEQPTIPGEWNPGSK